MPVAGVSSGWLGLGGGGALAIKQKKKKINDLSKGYLARHNTRRQEQLKQLNWSFV